MAVKNLRQGSCAVQGGRCRGWTPTRSLAMCRVRGCGMTAGERVGNGQKTRTRTRTRSLTASHALQINPQECKEAADLTP